MMMFDLDAIRARAAEHAGDAEALATAVRERADVLAEDARSTQDGAQANRAAYARSVGTDLTDGPLDFDAMVAGLKAVDKALADAEKELG